MVKSSKASFRKAAAGALAVLSLATYSLPANVGILSTRPTLSASATGTRNSIHVYGKIKNATGETLTIAYNDQRDGRSYVMELKNGKTESLDGDITAIYCPVKINFPSQWNQDGQKINGTPHVDEITNEAFENNYYVYTFNSEKGNTYQYENLVYGKKEVVFTQKYDSTSNGADSHTLADGKTEAHDLADVNVSVRSNSTYYFDKVDDSRLGNNLWMSNNYGSKKQEQAETTWTVNVSRGHSVYLNYWVSCEENIDYLNITVDGKELARNVSNGDAGFAVLGEGTHTVYAKYRHENDPTNENNQETCHFLDAAFIQFSNSCEKCDYTETKAFMQFDRYFDKSIAVENGYRINQNMNFSNIGKQYWVEKNCSVYSNDVLWFECFENDFKVTENVGNFKYNQKNYRFRYDFEIPHPELGVFIKGWDGSYDDTNSLFTCKAKKGVSADISALTVNDFTLTINPDIAPAEAERLKAVLESDETIKWIKPYGSDYLYYVAYNPEFAAFDDYDDTVFISSIVHDIGTYELTAENIIPAVDLITFGKDGKAYPNNYVSVVAEGADGKVSALTEGEDYKIVSSSSTSKSGEFTFEIAGLGNCTGSASKALKIAAASELTKVPAVAPTYGVCGNIEYYTTADGKMYLPAEGYTNGYKEVTEEDITLPAETVPKPTFKTQNLVLSGQIGVNFYLDLSMLTDEEKAASYAEFTVNGTTTKDTFDPSFMNQSGLYYGFTCYVNSVQMADQISVVFHYGDETVTKTYSVLDYINKVESLSSSFSKESLELIRSIADYGHYAQPMLAAANNWTVGEDHAEMTKYYADSYDYSAIREAAAPYERKASIVEKDIDKITYSLSLAAETSLNVFVAPATSYTGSTAISVEGLSSDEYTVSKEADGRYKVVISKISAHKLGDIYNIKITTANGVSTYSVSALSYVYAVLNSDSYNAVSKNAVSSLYKYYEATINYKNTK
ncbi:hypothetical protein [Ruminococcus sp.]